MTPTKTPHLHVPLTAEDNAKLLDLRAIIERETNNRLSVSEAVRLMIRELHKAKTTASV